MTNFWGEHPDVVSWDYSMNEAGGNPMGLEAYLRHIMTQFPKQPPKLIVKDTHLAFRRRDLIQYYYNQSLIYPALSLTARDPIVIHTDPAVQPFLDIRTEANRPIGFQEWRKFGTPPNAPGQSSHHPAVKEHELIAWVLTMHFLSALEIVAFAEIMPDDEADSFFYEQCKAYDTTTTTTSSAVFLPEPRDDQAKNSTSMWNSILFGERSLDGTGWTMNKIRCRTSFEPIVQGDLSEIVVAGAIGEDVDVMLPKSKMFYNSGWVLDLSDDEKKAKRNLKRFDGLGFVDSKKAYYGIYASGPLQFLLPFESNDEQLLQPSVGSLATQWFKSIVLCEVNKKRLPSTCDIMTDLHFVVGGVISPKVSSIDMPGAMYLGKKLCVIIMVPETATLTTVEELPANDSLKRTTATKHKIVHRSQPVGLLVTAAVQNNRINRRDDACSISHVAWEQIQSS
jgi:hypothetical protein